MLNFLYSLFVGFFQLEIVVYPVVALTCVTVFSRCYDWLTGRR